MGGTRAIAVVAVVAVLIVAVVAWWAINGSSDNGTNSPNQGATLARPAALV